MGAVFRSGRGGTTASARLGACAVVLAGAAAGVVAVATPPSSAWVTPYFELQEVIVQLAPGEDIDSFNLEHRSMTIDAIPQIQLLGSAASTNLLSGNVLDLPQILGGASLTLESRGGTAVRSVAARRPRSGRAE